MKLCSGCNQVLPLANFAQRGNTVQSRCNSCKAKATREWYQANKEYKRQKSAEYTRKLVEEARLLKDGPCTDCGKRYPWYQMEWDHLPGTEKLYTVSTIPRMVGSRKVLLDEIAKCELVCVLCHTQRTFERREQDIRS